MAGFPPYRLPSNVETDCAEDYFESRVPTLGLEPHSRVLQSRDADFTNDDSYLHSGPTMVKDSERLMDSCYDSGFDSVQLSSISNQRDSGLDLTGQMDDLHISESCLSQNPRDRDSGLVEGHGVAGCMGSELDNTCISCPEDPAYHSVNPDEPLPTQIQQLYDQDDDGDR